MQPDQFDDVWLDSLAEFERMRDAFEADVAAGGVRRLGRMLWESMTPEQRQLMLQRQPQLADGIRKLLGGV